LSARLESRERLSESQASPVDSRDEFRSTEVDLSQMLAWVVLAVRDTGWGVESLASHMERDKSYISRVLNGEKPLGLVFLLALPKDVQAKVAESYARHWNFLVVRPVSPELAVQHLVSGLLGMLAPNPSLRPKMAAASLRTRVKEQVG
jgi:hypothetical protein